MRDEDHRLPGLLLQPHHLVLHVATDQRVERAERLVVEHHRRVADERPRNTDALLHAAGELVGERVLHVLEPDDAEHLAGLARRSDFGTPRISRPNATLSITRRWASSPKCWKIIETECRRSSRSCCVDRGDDVLPSDLDRAGRSARSAGSASARASTCPDPERPITTNTSPGQTSNETSRTAATQPVLARSSERESSASGVPMHLVGVRPEDLPDVARPDHRLRRRAGCGTAWLRPGAVVSGSTVMAAAGSSISGRPCATDHRLATAGAAREPTGRRTSHPGARPRSGVADSTWRCARNASWNRP